MANDWIECKKDFCSGNPRIKNTRITVYNVISRIYLENDVKIACEDLRISIEQAQQAVNYCKLLKCIIDKSLLNFCTGCLLSDINENEKIENFRIHNDIRSFNNKINKLYSNSEKLKKGWQVALCIEHLIDRVKPHGKKTNDF